MASTQSNYERLMEFLSEIETVDTHEHMPTEADRIAGEVDFSLFFSHYCRNDLMAAGMPADEANKFYDKKTPLDEKWRLFEPYYFRIQDGSYCRVGHIGMEKFYGYSRLTSLKDAEAVTVAVRKANKKGLYKKVLKDAAKIRISLNYTDSFDPEFFAIVQFVTHLAEATKGTVLDMENKTGASCSTLDRYVEACWKWISKRKDEDIKGLKFHFAYMRDLHFAPRTHSEAEAVFNRIMDEGYGWRYTSLGYEESRPLQDYMVHRMIQMAGDLEIPVVFHSALQADMNHNADDARPLRLWNLPHRYRNVDFVILHAGLPWMEDAALLAKHYPNVYLDMGWDHDMSPELSTRALKTWIDLVPMNKVFGFGGDLSVVEKVYGHLILARRDIARALASKMETDGMSLERAKAWAQAIMFDNPKRVFKLDI